MRTLPRDDPDYPARLLATPRAPERVWVSGSLHARARHVAIVGARDALPASLTFARSLAAQVCRSGGVVLSGGASGVDTAAHEGALDAGARTLVVHPTGHGHAFPPENRCLFDRIHDEGGASLWPFPPGTPAARGNFHRRNRVLVGLADAVVVVQASLTSGTRNAAKWARSLGRALWVVPQPPWAAARFEGNVAELIDGASALVSVDAFLHAIGLPAGPRSAAPPRVLENPNENKLLAHLSGTPVHVDQLVLLTGLGASEVATALLTMTLEDVVVEGPARCFRRV